MRKLSLFILMLVIVGGMLPCRGQVARVAGLEKNVKYMQLLSQQLQLKVQQDSVVLLINESRKQFDASSDRGKIGQDIVRLEGELFEIRNQTGQITTQVAGIEQEQIIKNMDNPVGLSKGTGAVTSSRTLFSNSFFVENLSKSDISLFSKTPTIEPEVLKINKRIDDLYQQLATVNNQYSLADEQGIIDSLLLRSDEVKGQIESVDAKMERLWLTIYKRKLDSYLVLMDKIGNVDRLTLERLDQESRQVRRAEGLAGEQLAPLVATYPLQKKLILDYEITMARTLGLKQAEDSLVADLKKMPTDMTMQMTYPDIVFAPRSLVVYGPIVKAEEGTDLGYTSVEDVPVLHIPRKGVYYTVQLYVHTVLPKSITTFKNMTPLMYQELSGGRTRYLAGGFTTYKDALSASDRMVRAGFRASVAAFVDGKSTTTTKAKVVESEIAKVNAGEKGYAIEIIPAELRLPTDMRETITSKAPGKTIIRRSSGSDVIYSVGGFATITEAQTLAESLGNQLNVKIRVIEL